MTHASTVTDWLEGAPVRANEAGLQVPLVTLEKDGREVDVAGVVHLADAAFWAQYELEMVGRLDGGLQVQMECIRSEKGTGAVSANMPLPFRLLGKAMNKWIESNGFVLQQHTIKRLDSRLTYTDMTMEQLMVKLGDDFAILMAASLFAYPALATVAMVKRDAIPAMLVASIGKMDKVLAKGKAKLVSGEAMGKAEAKAYKRYSVIIEDRNVIGIDALNAAPDGTLAVWGAAHLPGILAGLLELGWEINAVEWRTAIATAEDKS